MTEYQHDNSTDTDRDYYSVLNNAGYLYHDHIQSGKTRQDAKTLAEKEMRDYHYADNLDIDLSQDGKVGSVWTGGHKGDTTLVYKGSSTPKQRPSDWIANAQLASGATEAPLDSNLGKAFKAKQMAMNLIGKKDRFQKSDDLFDKTAAKYGKENISLTGHSLGGYLAMRQGRSQGINSTVFNPADIDFFGYGAGREHRKKCEKSGGCPDEVPQTIYTTGKDIVSNTGYITNLRNPKARLGMEKDKVINYHSPFGAASPDDIAGVLQHSLAYFMPKKPTHSFKPQLYKEHNLNINKDGRRDWDKGEKMKKNMKYLNP